MLVEQKVFLSAWCITVYLPLERACELADHPASVLVDELGTSAVSTTGIISLIVNADTK
jgi:bifunctional ADP-heptose synthase (sugar kinase/adenylyltransferase)